MEARPPVGELRGMTGAARLGRERGLERGEAPRRRALGCERLAPVADEELLDRVGAGGGDEAEHRQRSDRCRIRSCYPFLRTRSQNPRGSMILMGAAAAISRRSRSPVTSTSARLSLAEARTHCSPGSRFGSAAGAAGFGATSCSRRNSSISLMAPGGRPIRFLSTRPSSLSTTSLVTRLCSASTTRSTSAHTPRVARALTKTFVSRKTLKRRRGRHPHPSGTRAPQRTVVPYVGAVQTSAGLAAAGGRHERVRYGSYRSACRADQEAFPARGPAGWSRQISCRTMYYAFQPHGNMHR